jgi:formyltetrahydrofolate synthetase
MFWKNKKIIMLKNKIELNIKEIYTANNIDITKKENENFKKYKEFSTIKRDYKHIKVELEKIIELQN